MRDLDIFDDDYFEPANEEVATVIFATNFAIWLTKTISNIIKSYNKHKSVIVDYETMIKHGIPANVAKKETVKTVRYFINHHYVKPGITLQSSTIKYSDLNDEGKEFIEDYFNMIGKISESRVKAAVENNKSKFERVDSATEFINTALQVIVNIVGGDIFGTIITVYDGFHIDTAVNKFADDLGKK
jgi:hypothetical protein